MIGEGWDLDQMVGTVILEGLSPFNENMGSRGLKNDILPQKMLITVKLKFRMGSHIGHPKEGKERKEEGCSIQRGIMEDVTGRGNQSQCFDVKNAPWCGVKRGVDGNTPEVRLNQVVIENGLVPMKLFS